MFVSPPPDRRQARIWDTSSRSARSARGRLARTPTLANASWSRIISRRWVAKVREQPFQARHPVTGERLVMVNLIGSWQPENLRRVVIGAHYDTRPHPDQEVDPNRHGLPFLGANDGASGVALLMEIAHHLNELETPWGVDLVLFDGEELVFGNEPRVGEYFLGSKEFARIYADQVDRKRTGCAMTPASCSTWSAGATSRSTRSRTVSGSLLNWSERSGPLPSLNARSFRNAEVERSWTITSRSIDAGIPTIDLIDFEYPFWHKADDLPENCSAESLAEVGRVVTAWLTLPRRRARR